MTKEYLIHYFDDNNVTYINSYWRSNSAEEAIKLFKENIKSNYSDMPSKYSVYELVYEVK